MTGSTVQEVWWLSTSVWELEDESAQLIAHLYPAMSRSRRRRRRSLRSEKARTTTASQASSQLPPQLLPGVAAPVTMRMGMVAIPRVRGTDRVGRQKAKKCRMHDGEVERERPCSSFDSITSMGREIRKQSRVPSSRSLSEHNRASTRALKALLGGRLNMID
jgi:hypothetical protein